MKNKLTKYLILSIAPFFFSCGGPVKDQNNAAGSSAPAGQKYNIDRGQSIISWKGSMLIGTNSHSGYIYISKGHLMINDDVLVGGAATIDMNTIEESTHKGENDLVTHLKSSDFFDVEKFPVSTIAITGSAPANDDVVKVTGNLTIKGITHPVTFPSKIAVKDGIAKMSGRLVIDRTQWDVRYQSGKFYDLLADQTMSDSIAFHINIVAKK
ncbi:MAG: YceI family protein [Bacteroidota bacterium]